MHVPRSPPPAPTLLSHRPACWATGRARPPGSCRPAGKGDLGDRGQADHYLGAGLRGADIVITSYTLLRLEIEDYESIGFAGLILDEAQAVKNHQSKAFGCVKRMAVPFKLAITGTPMENNLMELWAFSIVAPGLFPHPGRFTDYYRVPIEKGGDNDRLDRLRRRIRPLMLRRTKEQVAADLPAKQEQVLEVQLAPAHRRVYQRYLQRERQKVMGLLDDMDGNRFAIFRSLTLLRQASIDPALVDPTLADVESTKMSVLLELLEDVISGGHRTLVFSQFTGFLHRVARPPRRRRHLLQLSRRQYPKPAEGAGGVQERVELGLPDQPQGRWRRAELDRSGLLHPA